MSTLTPAYGRDYKSVKEVRKDYNNGKDFIHAQSGSYCSKRDFNAPVMLRYNRLMKITSSK